MEIPLSTRCFFLRLLRELVRTLDEFSDTCNDVLMENGTRIVDREGWETSLVDPGGSFRCDAVEGNDHSEGEDLR